MEMVDVLGLNLFQRMKERKDEKQEGELESVNSFEKRSPIASILSSFVPKTFDVSYTSNFSTQHNTTMHFTLKCMGQCVTQPNKAGFAKGRVLYKCIAGT